MTTLLLVACQLDIGLDSRPEPSGGGFLGSGTTNQGTLPVGIWEGENTTQDITDVMAFLRDGRLIMTGGSFIYFGSYPTTGTSGTINALVDVYNSGGVKIASGLAVNGNQTNATTVVLGLGAITIGPTQVQAPQTFNLTLSDRWERDSSLSLIAHDWTIDIPVPFYHLEFPIAADGALTAGAIDSDGCVYSGNLGELDTTKNLYFAALNLTGSGCDPLTGDNYSGFAALMPNDKSLFIIASNGTNAFPLELTRP